MTSPPPADQPGAEQKARRVRDLLSSYYGTPGGTAQDEPSRPLHVDTPQATSPASTSAVQASSDRGQALDSPAFDADRYLAQLIRQTRLDALLSKHLEMLMEIKSLDSDMQMLVYENYNKFISATDTIRSMKSNVDGMDSGIHDLKDNIEAVSRRSSAVSSKLQLRRDHIEELNEVRALLLKLQAVFGLPRRLRTAIDRGAYQVAVDAFEAAAPVLKLYGHKGAFRNVATEANQMAKEVTAILKERMVSDPNSAAECIQWVRKLGEPVASLQEDFLTCMTNRFAAALNEAAYLVELMAIEGGLLPPVAESLHGNVQQPHILDMAHDAAPTLDAFMVSLDQRFLSEMSYTVALYNDLFESDGHRHLVKVCRQAFAKYLQIVKRALANAAAVESMRAAGARLIEELPLVQDTTSKDIAVDWGTNTMVSALYIFTHDVHRVQGLLPELHLVDRATEVVEATVRHHVAVSFAALERRIVHIVMLSRMQLQKENSAGRGSSDQDAVPSQTLLRAYMHTQEVAILGMQALIGGMKVYQQQSSAWVLQSWSNTFVDVVQGHLQNLFLSLLHFFMSLAGIQFQGATMQVRSFARSMFTEEASLSNSWALGADGELPTIVKSDTIWPLVKRASPSVTDQPLPALLLLLSRICSCLETTAVPAMMESLAVAFPGQGGSSGEEQPPAFVAGEVARQLGTASHLMLQGYIELHARRLTLAVRCSMDSADWLHHKQPRGARPVCNLLLEHVTAAEREVVQLVDDGGRRAGHKRGISGLSSSSATVDAWEPSSLAGNAALQRSVSRLFREKTKDTGEMECTQASILAGIVRGGLKSMVESVRLQTLGIAGLQQLQLDTHHLQPLVHRYLMETEAEGSCHLLDDILAAALDRSTDPKLLEPHVLDLIMAARV